MAAGRPRKVIVKFNLEITLKTWDRKSLATSRFGNLDTGPIRIPGRTEDFQKAFLTWLSEYQEGPKRVRKPVSRKPPVSNKT
jgi:hypothetical protein